VFEQQGDQDRDVDAPHTRHNFRHMLILRPNTKGMVVLSLVLILAACRQETASRSNDTVNVDQPPPTPDSKKVTDIASWDQQLGKVFAVPAPGGGAAFLVFPAYSSDFSLDTVQFDLRGSTGRMLQLLRDGHQVATAQIGALTLDHADDCTTWPSAQLLSPTATTLPEIWTVGVDPAVSVLAVDSLAGRSAKDSTRLTIALARLASALPGDTAITFRGRPFVVRQASQFSDGTISVVVAEIVRTISQEATPLQEHLLLIARADSTERAGYRPEYFERTIGVEDATETTEVLAVVLGAAGSVFVLLSRDLGDGVSYGLLERLATGIWRVRWASAYAGC